MMFRKFALGSLLLITACTVGMGADNSHAQGGFAEAGSGSARAEDVPSVQLKPGDRITVNLTGQTELSCQSSSQNAFVCSGRCLCKGDHFGNVYDPQTSPYLVGGSGPTRLAAFDKLNGDCAKVLKDNDCDEGGLDATVSLKANCALNYR